MHSRSVVRCKEVVSIAIVAAVVSALGCATGAGVRDIPQSKVVGSGQRRSVTTSPLAVRIADPAQLATVSSVLVLAPTLTDAAQSRAALLAAVADSLEEIAERELSVTVMGKRWAEGAPDRGKLLRALAQGHSAESLRRQGIDALLRTEITDFVERRGSAVGGEPASVAFVMTLVRAADSKELWQGSYSYAQTFLSDNLLQLGDVVGERRRGPGWSSGREIFESGVASALRDLNARREQQFLALK